VNRPAPFIWLLVSYLMTKKKRSELVHSIGYVMFKNRNRA
jgi:hypothetical protein